MQEEPLLSFVPSQCGDRCYLVYFLLRGEVGRPRQALRPPNNPHGGLCGALTHILPSAPGSPEIIGIRLTLISEGFHLIPAQLLQQQSSPLGVRQFNELLAWFNTGDGRRAWSFCSVVPGGLVPPQHANDGGGGPAVVISSQRAHPVLLLLVAVVVSGGL